VEEKIVDWAKGPLAKMASEARGKGSRMTEHCSRNTVSAELREKLMAMPLWKRAEVLARVAAKAGEPIYEIEKALREEKKP
jgi:hypothetical protein